MIIDCHGHYSTREEEIRIAKKYATDTWAKLVSDYIATLPPSDAEKASTEEAWIDSLDRYGVDKVVLQVAPFGSNDAVGKFIKSTKTPDRFIGTANIDFVDPEGSNSVEELDRCVNELGLKGIGELYPQIGPWDPGDETCFPVYEKAQELGVPIMMHGGCEIFPAAFNHQQYSDPTMLDPALRAFPDLIFIICHMGIDCVGQLFTLMHTRKNLYAEISSLTTGIAIPSAGIFDVSREDVLRKFLERGFADRLLWATDVQAPYNSDGEKNKVRGTVWDNPVVKMLDDLNVSQDDKAKILGGNAERVFRLRQ